MMIPDKRVVWHPRLNDQFVVGGGTQITLFELGHEYPEIRQAASRNELHHMRCFAWSPDPQLDDLVAVGSTTGRVDLIRLRASAHARGPTAPVLSTGPSVPLSVRNSRACNVLAFSTGDPNYLAVGLDKVRGDPSLVVWDLTSAKPLLQIPGDAWSQPPLSPPPAYPSYPRLARSNSNPYTGGPPSLPSLTVPRAMEPQHSRADPRILQQHAAGEVVSALAFIPGTTHLLLAGISNRHFRFFDLRAPIAGSESPLSTTSSAASGSSAASPYTTPSVNSGSSGRGGWNASTSGSGYGSTSANTTPVSYRSALPNSATTTTSSIYNPSPLAPQPQSSPVRPTGTEIANVQVKVQGIAPDPLEPHRIACWNGDEGIVMIWDARKLKEPVLTFGERDALADGGYALGGYDSFGGPGECAVCGAYGSHVHHHYHLNGYGEGRRSGIGSGGSGAGLGVYIQAEWASSRRGTISTLEKDARFVRVWDVLSARPYVVDSIVSSATGMLIGATSSGGGGGGSRGSTIRRSWAASLSWPRGENVTTGQYATGSAVYSPFGSGGECYGSTYNSPLTLVLSDTRRTKSFPKSLSSFALVPSSSSASHDTATKIMVVNKEGDLELCTLHDASKQIVWSPRGDLAISGGDGFKVVSPSLDSEAGDERKGKDVDRRGSIKRGRIEDGPTHPSRPSFSRNVSSSYALPKDFPVAFLKKSQETKETRKPELKKREDIAARVVEEDISVVMQKRAIRGYGIGNPKQNADLAKETEDGHGSSGMLSELWLWIRHSQDLLGKPIPRVNGYDFSYQGLSAVWEGFPPSPNTPLMMYPSVYSQNRVTTAATRHLYSQHLSAQASHHGPYHPGMTTHQHTPTSTPTPASASLLQTPTLATAQLQYQQLMQRHQQQQFQQQTHHQQEGSAGHASNGSSEFSPVTREPSGSVYEYSRYPPSHAFDHVYSSHVGSRSLLLDVPGDHHPVEEVQPSQVPNARRSRSPIDGPTIGTSTSGATVMGMDPNGSASDLGLQSDASSNEESPVILEGATGGDNTSVGGGIGAQSTYQAYQAALGKLLVLSNRGGGDIESWKPYVATQKARQRQVALLLCGWSVNGDELMGAIRRWEKEGSFPRAACWLVFMKEYDMAVELLMRSNDEAHRMMSGTLAALLPSTSSPGPKNSDLRIHCERLILRLQDPYFRALLIHLTSGDWSDILEEESLPFRERLAIAFQFLDDSALSSYLKRSVEEATVRGSVESLMLTGLRCRAGMDIIQAYVDKTSDVQTAAMLSALTWPSYYAQQHSPTVASLVERRGYLGHAAAQALDWRPEKWVESYRDMLDEFSLSHCRAYFDIERGQVMNNAIQNGEIVMGHGRGSGEAGVAEWVPIQILVRCRYCGKNVNGQKPASSPQASVGKPTLCPHCNRLLPRCSICLATLGVVYDAGYYADDGDSPRADDAIVICQACRHGGHATHITEWFWTEDGRRNHETCAVANCDCRCADEF